MRGGRSGPARRVNKAHRRLFESIGEIAGVGQSVRAGPEILALSFASGESARRIVPTFLPANGAASLRLYFCGADTHDLCAWVPERQDDALFQADDAGFLFWNPTAPGILYGFDRVSATGFVWCASDRFPAFECARPGLPVIKAALATKPWVPVHAAAVARNGRAILLAGPSRT